MLERLVSSINYTDSGGFRFTSDRKRSRSFLFVESKTNILEFKAVKRVINVRIIFSAKSKGIKLLFVEASSVLFCMWNPAVCTFFAYRIMMFNSLSLKNIHFFRNKIRPGQKSVKKNFFSVGRKKRKKTRQRTQMNFLLDSAITFSEA